MTVSDCSPTLTGRDNERETDVTICVDDNDVGKFITIEVEFESSGNVEVRRQTCSLIS